MSSSRSQSTLFEGVAPDPASVPLAERVRPTRLDEVIGQESIVGPKGPLARSFARGRFPSMVLWGPAGVGKTTLARLISDAVNAEFVTLSAVLSGVADVRMVVAAARRRRGEQQRETVLFVDEIHRFNKAQQDAFLPHVEDGTITLIGATTENPAFSINGPLLSRCVVYALSPLSPPDVIMLLKRALDHPDGLNQAVTCTDDALMAIAKACQGDGRQALQQLQFAADHVSGTDTPHIDLELLSRIRGSQPLIHDRTGDHHYDVTSALIKSLRGSDPDASVYWMMRMLEAGEDPRFVLRRLIIFASEDIGNADPRALTTAVNADAAFHRLGMPEGIYAIAQATIFLACAPKSNATTVAFREAKEAVKKYGSLPVPLHLRNAPTNLAKSLGHGQDYRYPHNEPEGFASGERYLPDGMGKPTFYRPTDRGLERRIGEWLEGIRKDRE